MVWLGWGLGVGGQSVRPPIERSQDRSGRWEKAKGGKLRGWMTSKMTDMFYLGGYVGAGVKSTINML